MAGRQKVMSRELPFDIFIVRKVKKWEERAKSWGVDLVDAIGVSPLNEMMCKFSFPEVHCFTYISRSLEWSKKAIARRVAKKQRHLAMGEDQPRG